MGRGGIKSPFRPVLLPWAGPQPRHSRQAGRTFPHRLREHQVLNHIRAQLEPDALAPTHVLELLLPAPARRDAEGDAPLVGTRGDVLGLRVALEDPRGRPARSEVVADVVHGPALCGEREGELELWVCVWGMGSRRAMIKGSLPTNPTTPERLRWWARPSDDDFKVF